jgi:hypothetical protein
MRQQRHSANTTPTIAPVMLGPVPPAVERNVVKFPSTTKKVLFLKELLEDAESVAEVDTLTDGSDERVSNAEDVKGAEADEDRLDCAVAESVISSVAPAVDVTLAVPVREPLLAELVFVNRLLEEPDLVVRPLWVTRGDSEELAELEDCAELKGEVVEPEEELPEKEAAVDAVETPVSVAAGVDDTSALALTETVALGENEEQRDAEPEREKAAEKETKGLAEELLEKTGEHESRRLADELALDSAVYDVDCETCALDESLRETVAQPL